ncbi:MAG TPA: glycosyltransferase, partial [Fibrobacteria bacterium]|nr:glycosyltransferase [Fibrobacteria bacterium]
MIPHHFHLIWIGRNFPFVNRLAVESILQTNPGAEITIHFENPPDNADWKALQSKVRFKAIDLPALLASLPASMAQVAPVLEGISSGYLAGRSNILRYLILYREGGIYIDFDTVTMRDYRPLLSHPAFIGEEAVFRYDDDRVSGAFKPGIVPTGILFGLSYYLSYWNCKYLGDSRPVNGVNRALMGLWSDRKLNNAVLGCEPGNPFFARAIALMPRTDPKIKYALGPILMNRTWETDAAVHAHRLGEDHFYFIPPSQTYRFFY